MMIYKPKLRNLYLYVTNSCNLECKHCWIDGSQENKEFVDYQLLKDIIPKFKKMGLKRINLTGGEPLLHPKILDIIELLNEHGMVQFITTNGILLTKSFCENIKKLQATVSCAVSLDGAVASTHDLIRGRKGAYDQTLEGIKYLIEYDIPFEVIFTLQESNHHELKDVIQRAIDIGIESLRINFLQYGGGNRIKELEKTEGRMNIEEIIDYKKYIDEVNTSNEINVLTNLPFAFYQPDEIFNNQKQVCGMKQSIGLLPDGHITICGVGELKEELVIGIANSDNLEKIWADNDIIKSIRYHIPSKLEGVCGKCNLKNICCGCCIAQNYLENGSLFSSFNLCELMYKSDLFPVKYLEKDCI